MFHEIFKCISGFFFFLHQNELLILLSMNFSKNSCRCKRLANEPDYTVQALSSVAVTGDNIKWIYLSLTRNF